MKSLKNILASTLVLGSLALPTKAETPKPYVQTTFVSDYVAPSGVRIPDNCRQDFLTISPLKDLSVFVWQNNSENEGAVNERDFGINYSRSINSNFSANVGFTYWGYPTGTFGEHDSVDTASLNYSGKFDASLNYVHLNKDSQTENGDELFVKVSKGFSTDLGKTKLSVTPSLMVVGLDNFYGNTGISQATAGLDLSASRGNWNAHGFVNFQSGLTKEMETFQWGGASIGYQF